MKYELIGEPNEYGLRQIRYLKDLPGINAGELGGWLESEKNLSQEGNAWVSGNARVFGNARVSGNAHVSGDARVSGKAQVGNARVYGDAWVFSNADWLVVSPIGSRDGSTTITKGKKGDIVNCGCFTGSIEVFLEQVTKTHGDNNHARAYRAMIDMWNAKKG